MAKAVSAQPTAGDALRRACPRLFANLTAASGTPELRLAGPAAGDLLEALARHDAARRGLRLDLRHNHHGGLSVTVNPLAHVDMKSHHQVLRSKITAYTATVAVTAWEDRPALVCDKCRALATEQCTGGCSLQTFKHMPGYVAEDPTGADRVSWLAAQRYGAAFLA
jgi:molybdopterin converting factor small subunit